MLDISSNDKIHLKALSNKKFLITGCNGMLGNSFLSQLKRHIENPKIYFFDRSNAI